jgi:hypothetical protein
MLTPRTKLIEFTNPVPRFILDISVPNQITRGNQEVLPNQ